MQTDKNSNRNFQGLWGSWNSCHGSGLGWHQNNSDAIWVPFTYDSLCIYQLQMYYVYSLHFVKKWVRKVFGPDKRACIVEKFCLSKLYAQ